VRIRLERPAFGDFYFQASDGSVTLPVAGYDSLGSGARRRGRLLRGRNELAAQGFTTPSGKPYSASAAQSMLDT
jgi:hypothetical protein